MENAVWRSKKTSLMEYVWETWLLNTTFTTIPFLASLSEELECFTPHLKKLILDVIFSIIFILLNIIIFPTIFYYYAS